MSQLLKSNGANDTPEMVQKCLNCDKPECCNCYALVDREEPYAMKIARKKDKIEGMVKLGWTDARIAQALGICKATVAKHRREVLHIPPKQKPIVRQCVIEGGTI
jgi:DNA-binding NarL/FixJ family response regulator